MHSMLARVLTLALIPTLLPAALCCQSNDAARPVVLHAAHMLDVEHGVLVSPAELLITGERITAAGVSVPHPAGATVIDMGTATLMPGLIDAHVHLFLHPGAEDLQTVQESIPQRVLEAAEAARLDVEAGFTAERDMGTEGAGSADTALRDAIDAGRLPGPRMRICGNAISIVGGHEDAIGYNPAQHVLGNADYANTADEVVAVMRQQRKEGADFTKMYETGALHSVDGQFTTPYQYTEAQLRAAVEEARRQSGGAPGHGVAVHAETEPGTGIAAAAGVASVDHAYTLTAQTMATMKAKGIFAVPTFAIAEYFAQTASSAERKRLEEEGLALHASEFKRQMAAGVPFAVGSDVGPFPHGTQARELELMVQFGMPAAAVLRADLLNGASLLGWQGAIGELRPGYYADVIAVDGDPLQDISVLRKVRFVMKGGAILRGAAQPSSR